VSVPGSDAALINAIRSGEPGAYDVLRSRHGAAARRLASHLPRGQATVNDVVDWAFVQVLEAIRRGGGPTDAFRPYLLTAVQRAARDCAAGESSPIPTDDQDIPDPGQLMTGGPAGNGREETGTGGATGPAAIAAFMSLPERWRAVLWHTEVEDAAPAAVASLFGLGAAEAADLADRAREGMAQNAGIEPDGDAARMGACGILHQRRIAHRRSADDHAFDALAEPGFDRRLIADAAAKLQRNFDGAKDALDGGGIHRLAGKRSVEIDDVEIFKALLYENLGLRRRIVVEHGRARHVALLQAHGAAVFQIDGRKQNHGIHFKKFAISSSPSFWLFSG